MRNDARLALGTLASLAIASATAGGETAGSRPPSADAPQELVECTGWHALCTSSTDCKVRGDQADCGCYKVNENHLVLTAEIQDAKVRQLTQARCTVHHPCAVDRAPVCQAIREGTYRVGGVQYDWVSTYSYRGWCSLLPKITPCDLSAPGYAGDRQWAICDAAPCTVNRNPTDPQKPLSCQCRVVRDTSFVGMDGRCTGENGGIMSSMSISAWDFQRNTYTAPVPGYEYVQGACAPLTSDP